MAQQVKLKAQKRTLVGRNAIKKIKSQGLVPGVVYGSRQEPIVLQLNARDLSTVLARGSSEHMLVELEIVDGDQSFSKLALIQEVQHHSLRNEIRHVDFHAVSVTEKVISTVRIETVGEAAGVKTFGGLLEYSLRTIEVEAYPQDLPDLIRIDVSNLTIGDSVHVRDLPLPEGVEAMTDGDLTVVSVVESRVGEEIEAVAEAPAAPEVGPEQKEEGKEEPSAEA